jgi:phosphoribosylamine--glycine ligase
VIYLKVLVVGSGGREHALAWAVSRSPQVTGLYCAPGNGGTAGIGSNVPIAASAIDDLAGFAGDKQIDLTIVGPEAPLVDGIVDRFEREGLRCFGPRRGAARLEGSKVFAKEFMARHRVPTAAFRTFDDAGQAKEHATGRPAPMVVKADGLAAGKGVYVAHSHEEAVAAIDEIMVQRKFGAAGDRIIVEDCLQGQEVSVHVVCAGGNGFMLPSSQDHKQIYDGDTGPNTGGMGAYAPVPWFGAEERARVYDTVIAPTLKGMIAEGERYTGVLYAGLMQTNQGPMVLEFNVRFGDPETQVLLPLIKSDVFELLYRASEGELPKRVELWDGRSAATVVMAARGYPGSYEKGFAITGADEVAPDNAVVFHAGTARDDRRLVTSGGRVLAVTGWDDDLRGALKIAYEGVEKIQFDQAYWRTDIGHRVL